LDRVILGTYSVFHVILSSTQGAKNLFHRV
jgi:hypothetical protein